MPRALLRPITPPRYSDHILHSLAQLSVQPIPYKRCLELLQQAVSNRIRKYHDPANHKSKNQTSDAQYLTLADLDTVITELSASTGPMTRRRKRKRHSSPPQELHDDVEADKEHTGLEAQTPSAIGGAHEGADVVIDSKESTTREDNQGKVRNTDHHKISSREGEEDQDSSRQSSADTPLYVLQSVTVRNRRKDVYANCMSLSSQTLFVLTCNIQTNITTTYPRNHAHPIHKRQ